MFSHAQTILVNRIGLPENMVTFRQIKLTRGEIDFEPFFKMEKLEYYNLDGDRILVCFPKNKEYLFDDLLVHHYLNKPENRRCCC